MCTQSIRDNYIIETILRIDRTQKEVSCDVGTCITCEANLFTNANNTVPISFTMDGYGTLFANVDLEGTVTRFFRIEAVRDRRFATLRLITYNTETTALECTNQTMILDLESVVGIQCYSPINCTLCFPCCKKPIVERTTEETTN